MRGCFLVCFGMFIMLIISAGGCIKFVGFDIIPLDNEEEVEPWPDDVMPPPYPYADDELLSRNFQNPKAPYTGEAHGVTNLSFSVKDLYNETPDDGGDEDDVKVGDNCPDCNDPPGACGRGKVGDGRICQPCQRCGADGRIDEKDLASEVGQDGCNNPDCVCNDCDCEDCDCYGPKLELEDGKEVIPAPMEEVGFLLRNQLKDLNEKLDDIDDRMDDIESKMISKEEVALIAQREIRRMKYELMTEDGEVVEKEVELKPIPPMDAKPAEDQSSAKSNDVAVSVPGYSGTFMVPPGGKIVSITTPDGVVHRQGGPYSTGSCANGSCYSTQSIGNTQMVRIGTGRAAQHEVRVYSPPRGYSASPSWRRSVMSAACGPGG